MTQSKRILPFCSQPSPSEPSENGQPPTPQSTASATPATSAGSIFPGAVAAEATDKVAKRVEKPGTEMTAHPAKATEGGKGGKEEGSAAASATPADERTLPAAGSAPSSGIPDESEEKEIPHIDEDTFRAITTALREHRLTQRSTTTSQDKEVMCDSKSLILLETHCLRRLCCSRVLSSL